MAGIERGLRQVTLLRIVSVEGFKELPQMLVGYAALREKRSSSGSVVVNFMANRAFLDKITLRVVVADVPVGGSGYELRVKEFVTFSARPVV
jgi:hypothetical protein